MKDAASDMTEAPSDLTGRLSEMTEVLTELREGSSKMKEGLREVMFDDAKGLTGDYLGNRNVMANRTPHSGPPSGVSA